MVLSDSRGYHYCDFQQKMIRYPDEVRALLEKHSKYRTIDEFWNADVEQSKLSRADLQLEIDKMKELKAGLRHQIDCYKHAAHELNESAHGFYMDLIQKVPCHREVPQYFILFTPHQIWKIRILVARTAQVKQDAQESMDKKEAVRLLEELAAETSQIETKVKLENEKSQSTARLWWMVSRYTDKVQYKLEKVVNPPPPPPRWYQDIQERAKRSREEGWVVNRHTDNNKVQYKLEKEVKPPRPFQDMLKKAKRLREEDVTKADPNATIVSSPPSPATQLPCATNPVASGTRGSIRRSAPISQRTRSKYRRI